MKRTSKMTTFLAAGLLTVGLAWAAGTAGTVDANFGSGGLVLDGDGMAVATAAQSDGKIVAAGVTPSGNYDGTVELDAWSIRRYAADGTADTSFGTGGEVLLFGTGWSEQVTDLAIDGDGRLLVSGRGSYATTVTTGKGRNKTTTTQYVTAAALVRLESDGDLDATFGTDGVVFLDGVGRVLRAVEVQSDGKIVVARNTETATSGDTSGGKDGKGKMGGGGGNLTGALEVIRLTSSGALDSTFGEGGSTVVNLVNEASVSDEFLVDLAHQSDGGFVLAAGSNVSGASDWMLARVGSDGDVDTSFGTASEGGLVLRGLAVDASDRIVAVGSDASTNDVVLVRYTPDGARDTSFGSGGLATFSAAAGNTIIATDLAFDGSRILAGGWHRDGQNALSMVHLRFLADGSADTSYGTGGRSDLLTQSNGGLGGLDLAVTSGGDVVVVGTSESATPAWALALYCGS